MRTQRAPDVHVETDDGMLVIEIRDDGIGGADAVRGSGSDRIVRSRRGGGRDSDDREPGS